MQMDQKGALKRGSATSILENTLPKLSCRTEKRVLTCFQYPSHPAGCPRSTQRGHVLDCLLAFVLRRVMAGDGGGWWWEISMLDGGGSARMWRATLQI